jgi:hypothetical protein
MMFEMRLEGGFRLFMSSITPALSGGLVLTRWPAFCPSANVPAGGAEGIGGVWDVWPLDNYRSNLQRHGKQLCHAVPVTARTPAIGLISFWPGDGTLALDIYLSRTEVLENGLSPFEDWLRILKQAKDDLNKEIMLRAYIGELKKDEIEGFLSQKWLASSDLELEVRPRAIQWPVDD